MEISLKGKNVILIGASGSIGNSILNQLILTGARVGATYNKTNITISDPSYKDILITKKVDVRDINELKSALQEFIKHFKKIDALIYNSGICEDSLFPIMKYKDWRSVLDVNLDGAFHAIKILSKEMIRQKDGKIITIASSKGLSGSYGQANYAASKAGLIGFSKSIARDLGRFGISVNAVCPGFMVTNLNRDRRDKELNAKNSSVLGCISNPQEIASFTVYLLSDYVNNVSGQIFNIDSRL
ncbi:SDR family NAD(P)-dependent oxidoreductase [Metasolibacillus meyeri]|uniref:SDR family NAD(P)-dependent oxidoreductase n=1 Tax=Metasolibacillus meyeri TaxID=1071052 RepID=A0AAW9NVN1_9BACL|nr:SDR family NAD(P)-dependent oxidoreductase [Metasolibacillus meyeri]MEC1178645.1 SDR family NAD(P)-dependent oxidoreductase [Metasolibacillus meyeri]